METKDAKLWHQETVIRKKLRDLRALSQAGLEGCAEVYEGYAALLGAVSERLLTHYNRSHGTAFDFQEVVGGDYRAYLRAGVISVLVTRHIPRRVAGEFDRLFPDDPKDEYPEARRMKRRFVLHLGETNTGKTYDAIQRLKEAGDGVYLAPLRILALENFERLNAEGVPCSLLTGEEEIPMEGARHSSRTVEKADLRREYEAAVIDEVQLLADPQRGDAWTRAILGLRCPEIHLCGSMNARDRLVRLIGSCGDELEIVEYARRTPLRTVRAPVGLADARRGDAFVAFSKRRVLALSARLAERGVKNSVIYGDLPPEVRRLQYDAFTRGENPVLVSTDAIGMGVNLPVRRIIFTETRKFDGEEFRLLSAQEVKQIAGRAGRIGIYDVGYVACAGEEISLIRALLEAGDEPVGPAVVGPGEAMLEIGLLPLREKLALWGTREEARADYRKKDVRDQLRILDALEPYKLPEAVQWRLMQLPFDVNSETLMALFLQYVEERFVLLADRLTRPEPEARTLSAYETLYQAVNLYYSFSKALDLALDERWVRDARKRIGGEINRLLQAASGLPARLDKAPPPGI